MRPKSRPFVVGGTSLPIPIPRAASPSERAKRRLEMMRRGMIPIPIGLEAAPREQLEKLGIVGVEYSVDFNERYVPLQPHRHE